MVNIDTFIDALRRARQLNSYATIAAAFAALCALAVFPTDVQEAILFV